MQNDEQRPGSPTKKYYSFSLEKSTVEGLHLVAKAREVTLTYIVNEALRQYLNKPKRTLRERIFNPNGN